MSLGSQNQNKTPAIVLFLTIDTSAPSYTPRNGYIIHGGSHLLIDTYQVNMVILTALRSELVVNITLRNEIIF